jgi:hypothetical protein
MQTMHLCAMPSLLESGSIEFDSALIPRRRTDPARSAS